MAFYLNGFEFILAYFIPEYYRPEHKSSSHYSDFGTGAFNTKVKFSWYRLLYYIITHFSLPHQTVMWKQPTQIQMQRASQGSSHKAFSHRLKCCAYKSVLHLHTRASMLRLSYVSYQKRKPRIWIKRKCIPRRCNRRRSKRIIGISYVLSVHSAHTLNWRWIQHKYESILYM